MSTEVWIEIIGAISSITVAMIARRSAIARRSRWSGPVVVPVAVLALGLAVTSLIVSLVSFFESKSPQLELRQTTIAVRTPDQPVLNNIPNYIASHVPDDPKKYELDLEALNCREGYKTIFAGGGITASHPSSDVMYTVNPFARNGQTHLELRARKDKRGYAYVGVFVICSRFSQTVDAP